MQAEQRREQQARDEAAADKRRAEDMIRRVQQSRLPRPVQVSRTETSIELSINRTKGGRDEKVMTAASHVACC